MKFMDIIIDETLRLHPVSLRIDRETSNDYEYNNIKIKKGTLWAIPIYALHHDSSIYPEPDIFNPFRFDENSKKDRDHFSYLPFGYGPRSCIGMRFTLLSIKLLLAKILSKYKFMPCSETQVIFIVKLI